MAESSQQILIATSPASTDLTTLQNLASGFIAGTASRTITSPLDVIKMMMQISSKGGSAKATIKKLWDEDGIAGFWRGNVAACVRLGPQAAIKFFANDKFVKYIGKGKPFTGVQRTFYGALSGVISQSLTYPLDVIRTRITVDPKKYSGIFQSFATIVKEEGFGSLFSGLGVTILGVIPYEGAQFYAFGGLKNFYAKTFPDKPITPLKSCMMGAVAGLFSQTVSYPFDVVRKRLMLRDENGKPKYNGMIDAFGKIFKQEGIAGLYRGLSFNLIKGVPFAALQFTFNDEVRRAFRNYNAKKAAQAKPQPVQRKRK